MRGKQLKDRGRVLTGTRGRFPVLTEEDTEPSPVFRACHPERSIEDAQLWSGRQVAAPTVFHSE